MGSEAPRRRVSRKTTIEPLEDRQMFSADPLSGLLGGGIQHYADAEPLVELHDTPSLVQHADAPPDFWYDRSLERDLDQLPGDIDQTLSSAHGVSSLSQARQNYGFTGAGQTVAVIDSGIAYNHYALGGGVGANYRVVGGWDFTEENDADPYDDGPAGYHGLQLG
jgi:subtilisin family serine protease